MKNGVSLITPTGDRFLCFLLCQYYVSRQTRQPDQWIVVDDGHYPMSQDLLYNKSVDYFYREQKADDPKHTLTRNFCLALSKVEYDKVIIFEDDDWYDKDYIKKYEELLETYSLVGQANTHYYHVQTRRFFKNNNNTHSSLCQTAFRSELISYILERLKDYKHYTVDLEIWRNQTDSKFIFSQEKQMCIGIKGLPGRSGLTTGHKINHPLYAQNTDFDMSNLKTWIGNDYLFYESFFERKGIV